MEQALTDALADVKAVFAKYPKPLDVEYCTHCFTEAEIAGLFALPTEELMAGDLDRFLFKSYTTWGGWADLAYYVPRLLQLSISDDPPDGDMLLHKLLWAAHPSPEQSGIDIGLMMLPKERQAIFRFEVLVAQNAIETMSYPRAGSMDMPNLLAFLVAFDRPIAPFLQQWQRSNSPLARANLCAFMSDHLLNDSPRDRVLKNVYADALTVLPENQAALDALLSPTSVSAYLSDHAADVSLLGEEQECQP